MKRGLLLLLLIVVSCHGPRYEYVITDHGLSPAFDFVAEIAYFLLYLAQAFV